MSHKLNPITHEYTYKFNFIAINEQRVHLRKMFLDHPVSNDSFIWSNINQSRLDLRYPVDNVLVAGVVVYCLCDAVVGQTVHLAQQRHVSLAEEEGTSGLYTPKDVQYV